MQNQPLFFFNEENGEKFKKFETNDEKFPFFYNKTNIIRSLKFSVSVKIHKTHEFNYHCIGFAPFFVNPKKTDYVHTGGPSCPDSCSLWARGYLNYENDSDPNGCKTAYFDYHNFNGQKAFGFCSESVLTFFVDVMEQTIHASIKGGLENRKKQNAYPHPHEGERYLLFGRKNEKKLKEEFLEKYPYLSEEDLKIPEYFTAGFPKKWREYVEKSDEKKGGISLIICGRGDGIQTGSFEILEFKDYSSLKDEDEKERILFLMEKEADDDGFFIEKPKILKIGEKILYCNKLFCC